MQLGRASRIEQVNPPPLHQASPNDTANTPSFYSSGGGGSTGSSRSGPTDANIGPLNKLFDKYVDDAQEAPDTIGIAGTMAYLSALDVSLEDMRVLILSELLGSASMGELSRAGFVTGWASQGASTLGAQKTVLATQLAALAGPDASRAPDGLFRRVYKHTFKIALPAGSKGVPLDMALEYWKLLFGPQGVPWRGTDGSPWLEWWLSFLQERWKKAVNRDLWDQTLLFAEKTREDASLAWWSEESAWPGVIDEFVEWARAEKGVGRRDDGAMDVE